MLPPAICARCGRVYGGDLARLGLGNRLCDECASRPRSTCYDPPCPAHSAHDWEQGTAKLWCPGTDGGNPQVPTNLKHLAKKLMANSPTGRLQFPSEPAMQDLPTRPSRHGHCNDCHARWNEMDRPAYTDGCCCCYGHMGHGGKFTDA